jgi:hypothetical protein
MEARHPASRRWSLLAPIFVTALALGAAAPAHAAEPSPEVLGKVTKLNKRAIDAYQKQDYDTAKDLLKQALDICNGAHLEHHPITARTEIHIGVLLIGGLKQHDAGIKHFQKALSIQPDIQITKSLVTPDLQDAFEEAVLGAGGAGGAAPAAGGDDGDNAGGSARRAADDDQGGAGASDDNGDERPAPRRKAPKKPKKKRGDDDSGDDDKKDDDDLSGGGYKAGGFFLSLTLGSGYGIASGKGETTPAAPVHNLSGAGFAATQLGQISPEIGYFIKPDLLLSVQGRYQIINGTNPPPGATTPTSAIAAFARATFFSGTESFHLFFAVAAGAGYVRHAVVFPDHGCGPQTNMTCVDTIKGGPLLVGPAVGFFYDLGSTVSFIAALNSQLGLPSFTANFDLNVGLGFRL